MLTLLSPWVLSLLLGQSPDSTLGTVEKANAKRDLLTIAMTEAERSRSILQQEIHKHLQSLGGMAAENRPKSELVRKIVAMGPDALPILVAAVSQATEVSESQDRGATAALCIASIAQATNDRNSLEALGKLASNESRGVQKALLQGLAYLRHPAAVQIAQPFLQSADAECVSLAIHVLRGQPSETVSGMLRPMLSAESPHVLALLQALHALKDAESCAAVADILLRTSDANVRAECIAFVSDLDRGSALPSLRKLALETKNVPDFVISSCLHAVKNIGLRSDSAKKSAHELLSDAFLGLESLILRERAGHLLGPYEDKTAYEYLEKAIADRLKGRPSPDIQFYNHLSMAELRIEFQKFKDALESIRKAEGLDEKSVHLRQTSLYKAVANCELGKFKEAKKALDAIEIDDMQALLEEWPCFRKMAEDSDYKEFFEGNR